MGSDEEIDLYMLADNLAGDCPRTLDERGHLVRILKIKNALDAAEKRGEQRMKLKVIEMLKTAYVRDPSLQKIEECLEDM